MTKEEILIIQKTIIENYNIDDMDLSDKEKNWLKFNTSLYKLINDFTDPMVMF